MPVFIWINSVFSPLCPCAPPLALYGLETSFEKEEEEEVYSWLSRGASIKPRRGGGGECNRDIVSEWRTVS